MKTFVRSVAVLVTVATLCQAGRALAQDFQWIAGGTQTATNSAAKVQDQGGCVTCDPACCDEGCGSCFGGCDCDPPFGIVGLFGFDSFKNNSDLLYNNNFGAVTGLNAAMPVFGLSEYGIGWQLGMTYGVYDWDGTIDGREGTQQQTFITTGFYRKAAEGQRFSFGMVYDWMLNKNWGYTSTSPTLGQWRGQVEYALNECNGFGVYGCLRDRYALWDIGGIDLIDRSISHIDIFWHHKFASGADSRLWFGIPEKKTRVNGDGTLYDWIIGANIEVPLSSRLALYGNAEYVHPTSSAGRIGLNGSAAEVDSTWNIGAGIVWYFGGHAVSHSLNGKCWTPYLPVANNSTFLVDQGIRQ